MNEKTNEKANYSVLHKRYSGGPHGLGDPDDKYLRKVEKDVLVAKIVRDKAKDEKCVPEVAECCKRSKFAMVVTCRKENTELKDCLTKWYQDSNLWKESTEQYLKERSDYRRTGEAKKIRDFRARAANFI